MNYKKSLLEMMNVAGYTQAGIARKLGVRQAQVWRTMQPALMNKGKLEKRGITMEVFIRLAHAMNGRVILEWTDPRNCRHKKRWVLDNSEYWGDSRLNDEFLIPDDEG